MSPRAWAISLALGLTMWAIVAAVILAVTAAAAPVRATPLSIAQAAYPGSPCAGRIRVYTDWTLARRTGSVGEAGGVRFLADGRTQRISCDVAVDASYWRSITRYERCQILVHEAGHLAGLRHTKKGIMRPDHDAYVRACARL